MYLLVITNKNSQESNYNIICLDDVSAYTAGNYKELLELLFAIFSREVVYILFITAGAVRRARFPCMATMSFTA